MLPATCNLPEWALVYSLLYCISCGHFMEWMVVEFSLEEQLALPLASRKSHSQTLIYLTTKFFPTKCRSLMSHHINETELVSRKVTKHKFRKSIIEDWDSCCYICGEKFANITLDHIVPKKSGGHTSRANLAPCCSAWSKPWTGTAENWHGM